MGAALSIFVLLSVSVFVVRIAAVALRLTGMADEAARFQALSAFTGAGFTTAETEQVVNYPVRRRIASLLMVIGNLGLVSVLATVAASLVHTEGDPAAVFEQLGWLLAGMAALWFLMLNATADRLLCTLIGRVLNAVTFLGRRNFQRLLQIATGFSICEHSGLAKDLDTLRSHSMVVLGKRSTAGVFIPAPFDEEDIATDDVFVVFGADVAHEAIAAGSANNNIGSRV